MGHSSAVPWGLASPFLPFNRQMVGFGFGLVFGAQEFERAVGRVCSLSVLLPDGVVLVDPEYLKERRGKGAGPTSSLSRGLLFPTDS